ncbi:MAG: hypothetical protein C3F13_16435 [Anaerolineales bacterium]|nr:MAG: hypothetical protein C3F13_16435 [Anaerolineales bacterium]
MAGDEITVDQLRQLLGVQADLRQQAESRWQQAQRILVSLLESFAPEEVEQRLKSSQPLDSLKVDELGQLINQQINSHLRKAQEVTNGTGNSEDLRALKNQLLTIQGEIDRMREENRHLASEARNLREERDGLNNQLAALQQVSASQVQKPVPAPNGQISEESPRKEGAPEPDWMISWRKAETFMRDATVLRLLGETGLARRPLIELQAAERLGIRKAGGSLQSLFNRLEGLQLIEFFRPWDNSGAKTGGRTPDLLRLSAHGRLAYWLLAGTDPVQNEYDALLTRHISPEHTLLNLQAADVLCEAEYQVNSFPPDIHLPDGSLFKPDIVAIDPNGKTLYVEVEVEANKNHEQRQAKWRNELQASGGEIYVFCDNRSCMRSIRSEINFSLGRQAGQCCMTNLADLQAGKRAADGGIWLDVRLNRSFS